MLGEAPDMLLLIRSVDADTCIILGMSPQQSGWRRFCFCVRGRRRSVSFACEKKCFPWPGSLLGKAPWKKFGRLILYNCSYVLYSFKIYCSDSAFRSGSGMLCQVGMFCIGTTDTGVRFVWIVSEISEISMFFRYRQCGMNSFLLG